MQVKRAGFTTSIETPGEVLLKFKDELKLILTPSGAAKRVYIYDVSALLCCQPSGILVYFALVRTLYHSQPNFVIP